MNIQLVEKKWESELRRKFPGVIVRENRRLPHEDPDEPLLDVFMIPDELRRDFFHFLVNDYPKVEQENSLPPVYLLPHSATVTRDHHPDIWRLAQSNSSASAKSPSRKPRAKARRSLAAKKPVPAR